MNSSVCARWGECTEGRFWVRWVHAQLRMWLDGSDRSRGTGCVAALPENRVNVSRENRWIRPGPPLGGGRAAGGQASRTGVASSWNCFLVLSLTHTFQLGAWHRGRGHGSSFGVELPHSWAEGSEGCCVRFRSTSCMLVLRVKSVSQ